jgi:type II secretory pathway pseudopilin PulG
MTPSSRSGLTLIEVVVVVLVVVFLILLFLPPMSSHVSSRRLACMNNQHQLTIALQSYEGRFGCFPGYANRIGPPAGGRPTATSWLVPILPYVDRQDLYDRWQEGHPASSWLPMLVCPSDPSDFDYSLPWLSYVVNCGLPGDKDDTPATGVFHNHNVDAKPVTVSLNYIYDHDGGTSTLLLSENIQAGRWTDTEEADVGMVWWREPAECNRINRCTDVGHRPQDIKYARPSSAHGGVLVVSFCDGHEQQLRDTIDYKVYQQLMAPDDKAAGLPGDFDEKVLEVMR